MVRIFLNEDEDLRRLLEGLVRPSSRQKGGQK